MKNLKSFESIANLLPDIISILSKNGELLFNSSAALRIHGYTAEDLSNRNTLELIHPEDREKMTKELEKLQTPGAFIINQYRYLNKDGSYIWMEATAYNQTDNPLIEGIVAISRDISERKRLEEELKFLNGNLEKHILEKTQQLIKTEKAAFIGSHTAEIVHNLNGPIAIMDASLRILEQSYPEDKWIKKALNASEKIIDTVKSILQTTSNNYNENVQEVDLNLILNSELKLLEADSFFKYNVELKTSLGKIPKIKASPNHFSQCFSNLIKNALEALYETEKKILSVKSYNLENSIIVEIGDSGAGISEENLDKIFSSYFTTKPIVSRNGEPTGTGLGLSSVKRMLESYKAGVEVESVLGVGTIFKITIPVA
jgi:PAS domain S-box-containing protein